MNFYSNLPKISISQFDCEINLYDVNKNSNSYSNQFTLDKDLEDIHEDIDEKNNDNTDFSFFKDAAV